MTKQLALALALALALGACAHVRPNSDATMSLVAAERAFAADAQTRTVNEAFLAVLADDAVLLRPGPVNGRAFLAAQPMPATLHLYWTPTYAETSADGTLGFTTGPYESGQRGQKPVGTGHFVSVWRQLSGTWKLVFDGGAQGPIEISVDSAAALLRTRAHRQRFAPDTLALMQAERALGRTGTQPTRAVVAGSGDLGYVIGTIGQGAYAHIFRRDEHGQWQLAIDTLDPHVR